MMETNDPPNQSGSGPVNTSQSDSSDAMAGLSIGEQLRKMRMAAGYDMESFAQAINVSVAQLSQLESNQGFLFRDYKASALALRRAFTLLESGDPPQTDS
jgi:DNA-binding XRE family transcriptional regulator